VTEGLKVYHLPVVALSQQASLPTLYGTFHLLRSVLLRERIQLVHGHQSTSSLAHEALLHASTMGLGCVFTDHSLFPFSNAPAINLNKLMKFTLSHTQHVICVSHCSKENLCLRAYLEPERVSVIPNAVDCSKLRPDPGAAPKDIESKFTIVILSRLVYRKGVDLILDVIPIISARFPHVHWLIGGDGPKRALLEQMREKHGLHERVEMLGSVPHERVRSVLCRGHLFLNASLTEAFCIAILEAVSVGLFVVSTRVGGVPEILPEDMLTFAEPNVPALAEAVARAIGHVRTLAKQDAGRGLESYAWRAHRSVQHMYNWHAVAARTEKVYERVLHARAAEARRAAVEDEEDDEDDDEEARERKLQQIASFEASQSQPPQPGDSCVEPYVGVSLSRLSRLRACGPFAGLLFVAAVLLDHWLWLLLRWIWPAEDMDVAPDMPPPNELTPEQIDQFVEQRRTQMEESDDS
jgi:phosphatidylinositol glycan class A protein